MPTPVPPPALPPTIAWRGGADGHLELLDQTRLPHEQHVLEIHSVEQAIDAIVRLCVRGAPAIGVAAGYGLVLGVRNASPGAAAFLDVVRDVAGRLTASRPTAVNLKAAIDRCVVAVAAEPTLERLFREVQAIHAEDVESCQSIGQHGRDLVKAGATVLTHCNTGRLATAGEGTALAVLFAAWRAGVRFRVLANETRPLLQGTRLTALELAAEGIPVEVIVDGAAAGLIARGQVNLVLVGADRIAANGDFANKVGTYGLALACAAHRVPFYVAAPVSTFDLEAASGDAMPLEQRDATEVLTLGGQVLARPGLGARNPAFDITPGRLVRGFITDLGVLEPPFVPVIKTMLSARR
ncbi:MAG TPA: S-methyl-5-thioribose-1-phosphate isomerase [Planctomycetota bacterium]